MPRSPRSLSLTSRYRSRLFTIRDGIQRTAERIWDEPERLAAVTETAQNTALRLTGAYLAAFYRLETGKPARSLFIDTRAYSGRAADGQPLARGLRSPRTGYFAALNRGKTLEEATRIGVERAKRQVGMNYDAAHRKALSETIKADERFSGSQRSVRGTCGACAAFSGTPHMLIHPGCQCVEMPIVAGVESTIALPTGTEIFNSKTPEEQDAMVGPEAADRLRRGEIRMDDLVERSRLDSSADDFITQAAVGG